MLDIETVQVTTGLMLQVYMLGAERKVPMVLLILQTLLDPTWRG